MSIRWTKKEDCQMRLFGSIANGDFAYYREDLKAKLKRWKKLIEQHSLTKESTTLAGGRYYFFEKPAYLTQFDTNIEALEYLIKKIEFLRQTFGFTTSLIVKRAITKCYYFFYCDSYNDLLNNLYESNELDYDTKMKLKEIREMISELKKLVSEAVVILEKEEK